MAAKRATAKRKGRATRGRSPVTIDAEERRHLVEACAFFRADHFRQAEPGSIRSADMAAAAADVDAVLGAPQRGRKK